MEGINVKKTGVAALGIIAVFLFGLVSAAGRRPVMVEGSPVSISEPEAARTYYGRLDGSKDTFVVDSPRAFELWVRVLVPDAEGAQQDVSMQVYTMEETPQADGQTYQLTRTVALLDAGKAGWAAERDFWTRKAYRAGGEFGSGGGKGVMMPAGKYYVKVYDIQDGASAYALQIGTRPDYSIGAVGDYIRMMARVTDN